MSIAKRPTVGGKEITSASLAKSFEPQIFEQDLYRFWEESGCFRASDQSAPGQPPFSMVIPPPNVTGALHMGHALTNTLQDILTRWHRMRGFNTLWLPGTDHAGIATQAVVEKQLSKEKGPTGRPLTRHDIGREEFLERTWKWKEEYGSQITNQLKRLGSSLDWQRERFTMDEGCSRAVREVFVQLHEEGLIYRGERIINWCPKCQTALSDLEVIPTERKGTLYYIKYFLEGSKTQALVVATTRPETLLGDTAVAVHPDDERNIMFHGKKVQLPLVGRLIPVITDEYVDREFGTGALKVTPAHDFNDYELGLKHHLPVISVMGKDGRMTAEAAPFAGLKFAEAREQVVAKLKEEGLLVKTEDHPHKVGLCQRCDQVAEPMISKQWFVKIAPLAKPAIEAVQTGKITFTPKVWEKTYFEWMFNIRDWCISRQLWWGHQIPAWYCGDCEAIMVARIAPTKCSQCGKSNLTQDEDVLDTWFSSALWPFATLGWPEKTAALKTFYPTTILETGFDIIFFWVARMIMMGIHFMEEVPFRKVYLHAMVRDEKGEKMSKSKGNVIDPLDLISLHGTDALRMTLASMAGQGRDIKLSADRVEGYRAFCNKVWNATKFFHLQQDPANGQKPVAEPNGGVLKWLTDHREGLLPANRWILSRLQKTIETVDQGLEKFEIDESAKTLYDFTWFEFCDWYIEFSKRSLQSHREQTLYTLQFVLETLLRLMHPLMPFVTEELWQTLPWTRPSESHLAKKSGAYTIMLQAWPTPYPQFRDVEAEKTVHELKAVIEAIRNFRGENSISPKTEFAVKFVAKNAAAKTFVTAHAHELCALARVQSFVEVQNAVATDSEAILPIAQPAIEMRIDLSGLVNVAEEQKRVVKEIAKIGEDLAFIRNKLSKESFISKAPAELVAKEKQRESELLGKQKEMESALRRLEQLAVKKGG